MPSVVYGAVSVVLVVAVVAVAYGSAAPQLGVAEFAPAARSAVSAPPTTESALSAARGEGRRSTTTLPPAASSTSVVGDQASSSSPTTRVGRARPCFGDPPRQLPDPRSPVCAATTFEGDNGGATSPGVTPTEIRVAWPVTGSDLATHQVVVSALFEYMNRHFEFYGRRLVPMFVPFSAAGDLPSQRAFAAQLATEQAFAVLERTANQWWYPSFFQELGRNRLVTIALNAYTMLGDREMFDEMHPYLWSVYPSMEQTWSNLADFACRSLVGRPASHAGPSLVSKTRRFGVLAAGNQRVPSVRALVEPLRACGAEVTVAEWLSSAGSTQLTTAMQRFKADGVTTLVCACADNINTTGPSTARSNGLVDAEWLLPWFTRAELDELYAAGVAPEQRPRLFGMQAHPKVLPFQAQWWLAAAREVDQSVGLSPTTYYWAQTTYDELLVLASGIQAAGPTLTPDTFAAGLLSARFSNTGAGVAPYFQPSVGFGPGDHSFYNDFALAWWSDQAEYQGYNAPAGQSRGSWCYLGGGARYQVGSFPADADSRFFTESCR